MNIKQKNLNVLVAILPVVHKAGIPLAATLLSSTLVTNAYGQLPQTGVTTISNAQYELATDGPVVDVDGDPGNAFSEATAGPGGPGIGPIGSSIPQDTFDESIARARANLPGTVGSYSHAGGFSPGSSGGGSLSADAKAASITHWQAVATAPGVLTADIDVLSFFDGVLTTGDFGGAGAGQLTSSVQTNMTATTAGGGSLFGEVMSATLDSFLGLSPTGEWTSDWVTSGNGFGVAQAAVNYSKFYEEAFTVNVGEVFAWEVDLETAAYAGGAFELWAIADFYNSGDFALTSNTPGIELVQVPGQVPLPAAAWLFGSALLGLFGLKRRQRR